MKMRALFVESGPWARAATAACLLALFAGCGSGGPPTIPGPTAGQAPADGGAVGREGLRSVTTESGPSSPDR